MPGKKLIEPIVFSKSARNPIFGQIFDHQRAKNEARNTKMNGGQETHPIRVNARYEMNWAHSFFKKFRKPSCLQTDGRTGIGAIPYNTLVIDRGESSIPPFHLRWGGGINMSDWPCDFPFRGKAEFETAVYSVPLMFSVHPKTRDKVCLVRDDSPGPPLLTWFNFNPSMNK